MIYLKEVATAIAIGFMYTTWGALFIGWTKKFWWKNNYIPLNDEIRVMIIVWPVFFIRWLLHWILYPLVCLIRIM